METAPLLDEYEIAPMLASERNYVLDSWMRSSRWRRDSIMRCVERGQVLVCRVPGDDYVMGWLCTVGTSAAFGVVREGYRELGVMRALWERAGKPITVMPPTTGISWSVLRRLQRRAE